MSVRFVCGPSGSGKTSFIRQKIINGSLNDPERKYLLIVPDQFTMQAQVGMIRLHPDHAFSAIEVLSFSRLSHRILEEVGGEDIPVLDDTGKSLIIRHVAESISPDLVTMSSRLDRTGFIHEVKSALSEFMQYGIGPDDLDNVIARCAGRRSLALKLKDLQTVYRAFMEYKSDNFITGEETLDKVRTSLHKSELIRDAVIAFDGFTGFTPIQEKVIQELMVLAHEVVFSLTAEQGWKPGDALPAEDMFWLTARTIDRLKRLADEASVPEESAVLLSNDRPEDDISHLERYLFRSPFVKYEKMPEHLGIYKARTIREEVADTFQRIRSLICEKGLRYRDIAIVTGDIENYADEIAQKANELMIPVYLDHSRSILMSPFIEAVRSAADVIRTDMSRESVIRHLRTGFGPLNAEETDELENFLLATGIRGRSSYERMWTSGSERINESREKIRKHFEGLHNISKGSGGHTSTISSFATALYGFMDQAGMYERLMKMSAMFEENGDQSRAAEYSQVWMKVMDLLDQITGLCGEDEITFEEFMHMIEAGFSEIRLGVIPRQTDEIAVGDMIRSRLSDIKILFLLGANDSNIPGKVSTGGLISDLDREFITQTGTIELAPTPREQMFTQRLYLYMNMTKPSGGLYISYATADETGTPMQPSYLISTLCKLFPSLSVMPSVSTHRSGERVMPADRYQVYLKCAELMRRYTEGRLDESGFDELITLCAVMNRQDEGLLVERLYKSASAHYSHTPLSAALAEKIYDKIMQVSVSRLEKFAGCAYAHFLNYGLKIRARSEYSFESADMGEVYHKTLEEFSNRLKAEGLTWEGLSEEDADAWVEEIMDRLAETYGDTILVSSNTNIAMTGRIKRVLKRSIDTIRYQVINGSFVPEYFEKRFDTKRRIKTESGETEYRLVGKIDRIDICRQPDKTYLRIVDYKSGNRDFDISSLYHGLMLQLAVYMSQALEATAQAEAAGMLYYHIDDPMVSADRELSDEEALANIRGNLKMKGALVADTGIAKLMDSRLDAGVGSDIIPVKLKKDSGFDAFSRVYSPEDLRTILEFAAHKLDVLVSDIRSGDIAVRPVCVGNSGKAPCDYCDYASVCGITSRLPGYNITRYEKEDTIEIIDKMKEEMEGS